MANDYKITVKRLVDQTEEMALAVMKTAIASLVVDEMQRDRTEGGKIPIDTGFLIQSGQAALNSPPSGASEKPSDAHQLQFSWEQGQFFVVLDKMKIDDTFYFGWTAEYAEEQNTKWRWVESAMMNWQHHLNLAIGRLKE